MPTSNPLLDRNIEQFIKDVVDRYYAARETFIPHEKISRGKAKNKVKDHLNYLDMQSLDSIMKAALS